MATLVCPFMSDVLGGLKQCIESGCQVWDTVNDRCGAKTSDIQYHVHNSHWHGLSHTCAASHNAGTFYNICGTSEQADNIPKAIKLLTAYNVNEDMDGTGLVYGFDYYINPSDTEKPPVLIGVDGQNSNTVDLLYMNWDDYTTFLNDPTSDESVLFKEACLNSSLDGTGYIYMYDFKIDSSDTNKPDILVHMEESPAWSNPNVSMTWADYQAWKLDPSNPSLNPFS